MAITFKHDAAGLVGAFAEGQARKQKYGRELLERQQKYAFETQQRNQDRAYNAQQRQADQQLQIDRDNNMIAERRNERAEDVKLKQEAFELQKAERLRQEGRMDRNALSSSIPDIPDNATPEERMELGKMRSGLKGMLNPDWDISDPSVRSKFDETQEAYNARIAAIRQKKPSLNDQVEYLDPSTGKFTSEFAAGRQPYWKGTGKPIEMPTTQPTQEDRRKEYLSDQKVTSSTYAQLYNENKDKAGEDGVVKAPTPDQVYDRMEEQFKAREARVNPQATAPSAQTPQPSAPAASVAPPEVKQDWANLVGVMGSDKTAPSQPAAAQPTDNRPATIQQPGTTVFGTGSQGTPAYPTQQAPQSTGWNMQMVQRADGRSQWVDPNGNVTVKEKGWRPGVREDQPEIITVPGWMPQPSAPTDPNDPIVSTIETNPPIHIHKSGRKSRGMSAQPSAPQQAPSDPRRDILRQMMSGNDQAGQPMPSQGPVEYQTQPMQPVAPPARSGPIQPVPIGDTSYDNWRNTLPELTDPNAPRPSQSGAASKAPKLEATRASNVEKTTNKIGPRSVADVRSPVSGLPIQQQQTIEPNWESLGSALSKPEQSQLGKLQQLYSTAKDPQIKQAIQTLASPQASVEDVRAAAAALLRNGIDIRQL